MNISNFGDLFNDEQKASFNRMRRICEALVYIVTFFACGGITGYWIRDNNAKEERLEQRREFQTELERTTLAYKTSLDYLANQVQRAAGTVAGAASAAQGAIEQAQDAAVTAQEAAKTARVAAKQSATDVNRADRVPEPTREQINRAVDRANRESNK